MKNHAKYFLALFLCLTLLSVQASAAAPTERGCLSLLNDTLSSSRGSWRTVSFSPEAGSGTYIRVTYCNDTDHACTLLLYRSENGEHIIAQIFSVAANSSGQAEFHMSRADTGRYHVELEANGINSSLVGVLTVEQYERESRPTGVYEKEPSATGETKHSWQTPARPTGRGKPEPQMSATSASQLLNETFGLDEAGNMQYPDEFAGAWLANNTLVIALTDTSEPILDKYRSYLGAYADIVRFEYAQYSYHELQ